MTAAASASLLRTPLYAWHAGHGARMVDFSGWSMPLQFAAGVTREHVATRTGAGLFDICHMGRFRVAGARAQAFLSRLLSNDPALLASGQAQYTLLANEGGGAIDDAYLYRLAADEFLLVVNASNRARDWDWLHAQAPERSVHVSDRSESLAMLALQGPGSQAQLASVIDVSAMPEARRNRLTQATFEGHELIVARTGYTGEALGFELFVPAAAVVALWQRLVDAGAVPAGLGARDSLRLEAGLPLYGHELGADKDGHDIPIFANRLARYGVRKPGNGPFVGCAALDAQRAEYDAIMAATMTEAALLPRLVQPLAVFGSRRPLRAGYEIFLGAEPVGYVTSGTSVPVIAPGTDAAPEMRPIGLALLRSSLRYRAGAPLQLAVHDGRGAVIEATLVERNLPSPPRSQR